MLQLAERSHTSAEESGSKPRRCDLSHATCVEADNGVMWEGVAGAGWLVATPPLFAPGRQGTAVGAFPNPTTVCPYSYQKGLLPLPIVRP